MSPWTPNRDENGIWVASIQAFFMPNFDVPLGVQWGQVGFVAKSSYAHETAMSKKISGKQKHTAFSRQSSDGQKKG
jgi:hypothetical protein